ncbi:MULTISPECIES: tRNA 5-hydroxyuridine modification protein YegQ [Spongiibacter]|uniref:prephenate-dependent tRNA uridine(34) hydroxylase TrhP n=1 Tax=Spongiibacter TaxID=630749 RepID=UPI000C5717AD|nr:MULTISPECIES: tRNA 5-hydroxyuridine modification protein YegQ [Spongiibacter]MBO6753069.1 tRNA 5-hydroxyuridine modification protein YegQ [Spongiibacter sp.]MBU72150.1 U32 family peptidase [Spongiibacter sp.]|tara:strand:- start:12991 stop:14313 length:1323 start_codon:yes stop_codon:yes gene_type:complete
MPSELLSPAGSLRNMRYAFAYGADAVYAGQPRYSLRVRNNEFKDLETLATGINEAHALGKQFYLASNVSPHNNKVRSYIRDLEPVVELGPDALIMADPGLMMLVRERWPDLPIHLSVQANAVNWATVKFWYQNGIRRVILSRELSLDEIEEIRQRVPEMELEVFVHGALCIAYSGRCLLSGYMNHRDPNQGACTNACRWEYQAHEAKEDETGDLIAVQSFEPEPAAEPGPVLLQQAQRPGEYMPAYEDEHGTYIMNSKDLRAVQHVQRLQEMGIHSLKIEGRTKSHYYVARTAQVYRRAIDDAVAGKPFDMGLMDELETLANRGYTEGFYRRHPPKEYQSYEQGSNPAQRQQFVAEVVDVAGDDLVLDVKNRFALGDELLLMSPSGNRRFQLGSLLDKNGKAIEVAPGSGHRVRLPMGEALDEQALRFGLLVKDIHSTGC